VCLQCILNLWGELIVHRYCLDNFSHALILVDLYLQSLILELQLEDIEEFGLFWLHLLAFSIQIYLPVLRLLRLHFRSKYAVCLPVLVLCVVLLLMRVHVFALLLVSVLVLIDRLRVIELMPHVLILFVAHLPRATLLPPLAVAVVVVLRVVCVGFHGPSRAPPGLLGAPTASVVVSVSAVTSSLVLLLSVHIPAFLVSLICVC
jgi:hypothetical protein